MLEKYSIEEINDALDCIDYQLDNGYFVLGTHDHMEFIIVKRALDLFKEKLEEGEI